MMKAIGICPISLDGFGCIIATSCQDIHWISTSYNMFCETMKKAVRIANENNVKSIIIAGIKVIDNPLQTIKDGYELIMSFDKRILFTSDDVHSDDFKIIYKDQSVAQTVADFFKVKNPIVSLCRILTDFECDNSHYNLAFDFNEYFFYFTEHTNDKVQILAKLIQERGFKLPKGDFERVSKEVINVPRMFDESKIFRQGKITIAFCDEWVHLLKKEVTKGCRAFFAINERGDVIARLTREIGPGCFKAANVYCYEPLGTPRRFYINAHTLKQINVHPMDAIQTIVQHINEPDFELPF